MNVFDENLEAVFEQDHLIDYQRSMKEWFIDQIYPNGLYCPFCKNTPITANIYIIENADRLKCGVCLRKFSILKGTMFEGTKLGLGTWTAAMSIFACEKGKLSPTFLMHEMSLTYVTAWKICLKLKRAYINEGNFNVRMKANTL